MRTYLSLLKYYQLSQYLIDNDSSYRASVNVLEQALGVIQHHDGITGTEYQFVSDDYVYQIVNGTFAMNGVISAVLKEQVEKQIHETENYEYYDWNLTSREWSIVYS